MNKLAFVAFAAVLLLGGCVSTWSPTTTVQQDESRKIAAENEKVRTEANQATDPDLTPPWCDEVNVGYQETFSGQQSSDSPAWSNRIQGKKKCVSRVLVRTLDKADPGGWTRKK